MNQLAATRAGAGRSVFQTILHTSVANLLIMVLSTLTSIVTARLFGVEGKGMFSAILFWPTLLAGLVSFGLPTSLIYNMKIHAGKAAEYIRAGFMFQVPVSVLVGTIAWIGLPVWLGNYPDDVIRTAQWYTILTLPMLLAVNLLTALTQSMDKFVLYNGLRLYVPLSNLLGLLVLWAIGKLSLHGAALIFFGTSLMVIFWALYRLRHELSFNWLRRFSDRIVLGTLFGYGGRVFGVELLGTLYSQCDKLIILTLLTPRDFGLYTVVYTLSRVFNVVQTAISNVIFPKVTGLSQDKIIASVGRAFRLSFLLMTIAVIPGMLIGHYLLGLLYGEQFLEAGTAFYLLSLECIIGGGSWILASSFNAMGRPGLVAMRQAIALAITVGLFFILTPLYGLNGIAIALLLGAVIRILITIAAMRIVFKVRILGILYDKSDLRFLYEHLSRRMQT
ncbi:lipopolysaccharide biosynthesis protein [Paenibacillus lignilyticus]|uniref:Oligosaccharide flippase family protein n=1 Tax=Paenibacillus lignilyticus TaxID=1172615 RepID=A0ABS5C773_9BACL|nr:oligosaccharide flippase family protein [Paenibacillus lignilyticus]MBP3961810.1 oligosaccharide flippase family protein [Paenibacillus lignilyticus]MBP3963519.1 oligosaccharide flippase family protein [Paenibacillus lignilyticus]